MSLSTAVTLDLVRAYLSQALPVSTLRALAPYFERARETLSRRPRECVWPAGPARFVWSAVAKSLRPAEVTATVTDVVYEALLEERRLCARYRPRGAKEEKDTRSTRSASSCATEPWYLFARSGATPTSGTCCCIGCPTRELLSAAATVPRGFDYRRLLGRGRRRIPPRERIKPRALVDVASLTLSETPLTRDQRLVPHDGSWHMLEATVQDTEELRGWLSMYGPGIEILAPMGLRREFATGPARWLSDTPRLEELAWRTMRRRGMAT